MYEMYGRKLNYTIVFHIGTFLNYKMLEKQ